MLITMQIERYGTPAVKAKAKAKGLDPLTKFAARVPEYNEIAFSDEFTSDFLAVLPSKKYSGKKALYQFIIKHMMDRLRAVKRLEGKLKVLSGAQMMNFMTISTIEEIEAWKEAPTGIDRDNIVRRKLGLMVVELRDEDEDEADEVTEEEV